MAERLHKILVVLVSSVGGAAGARERLVQALLRRMAQHDDAFKEVGAV